MLPRINCFIVLLIAVTLLVPEPLFARGFGGGGGGFRGGGGGGFRPAGGGGFAGGGGRPNLGGGGGNFGGGGGRPNFGGGNLGGGGGQPFSHQIGGGGASRPNLGGGNFGGGNFGNGNRPNLGGGNLGGGNLGGGNRPNLGAGNLGGGNFGGGNLGGGGRRPNAGGGQFNGGNRPNIGNGNFSGGNRANIGNGVRNDTNLGNRTNIGHIGNNNFNQFNNTHNNINIASNRQYYNNWQHGHWNGNWNRPGGAGYWNGYAHGYSRGYWNGGWGGYWHGAAGGYWGRPWYAAPIAWGLGSWAVGSIIYSSGYSMYSNPYYVSGGTSSAYYDYSQPITVINQQPDASYVDPDATVSDAPADPVPYSAEIQEGTSHVNLARDAFKNGDYATAMREIELALKSLPKDAALHEFRALVLFATKDYSQAAATLYAVLSAGPGWDWTTLSGFYASVATYTEQLRLLEQFVKSNPSSTEAHFVLAYHYLTCGYNDAAIKQYKDVVKLQPADQLSAQLLKLLGDDVPAAASTDQPKPEPAETEPQPVAPTAIDASKIVGNWTAKKAGGPTFSLNLTNDAKFTWGYDQGGKHEEFGGKYSVDGAILVLERTDGSQMPGLISLADNGFNFKLYGGPPEDPGLDFTKK